MDMMNQTTVTTFSGGNSLNLAIKTIFLVIGGFLSGVISLYVKDYLREPNLDISKVNSTLMADGSDSYNYSTVTVENVSSSYEFLNKILPRKDPAYNCNARLRLSPGEKPNFPFTLGWGESEYVQSREIEETEKTIYPGTEEKVKFCIMPSGQEKIFPFGHEDFEERNEHVKLNLKDKVVELVVDTGRQEVTQKFRVKREEGIELEKV